MVIHQKDIFEDNFRGVRTKVVRLSEFSTTPDTVLGLHATDIEWSKMQKKCVDM